MSEFKEVWYVWDGESRLPDKILRFLDGDKFSEHIAGYTLGEKRRRCVDCDGKGKKKVDPWFTRVCQACNGTGWEYKK